MVADLVAGSSILYLLLVVALILVVVYLIRKF
jgi:hypothetical protein